MHKWFKRLGQLEDFLLFFLFLALLGLTFSQVILRNFFESSIVWADVAVRVLVLWVAVFGAMIATRRVEHIQIDLFESLFPSQNIQKGAAVLYSLAAAGVAFVVAFYSFEMVRVEYTYPTYAFAKVPTWVAQSVLPFGFSVMGIRFLRQSISHIFSFMEPVE